MAGTLALSADCCNRIAVVSLAVGKSPSFDREKGDPVGDVWICPGTEITVAWRADNGFTTGSIAQFGAVPLPYGFKPDAPTQTSKYHLHVSGDGCEMDGPDATVHMVNEGDIAHLSLRLVSRVNGSGASELYYWETDIQPIVWDPKISMTSIMMEPFPPQQPNAALWNAPVNWTWTKKDLNGTVRSAPAGWTPTTPWGNTKVPVVGLHHLEPSKGSGYPNTDIPLFTNIQVTLSCK
jgi:hypothetical protein